VLECVVHRRDEWLGVKPISQHERLGRVKQPIHMLIYPKHTPIAGDHCFEDANSMLKPSIKG
jgi:hypothetical protein